jgi:hypothetical protein
VGSLITLHRDSRDREAVAIRDSSLFLHFRGIAVVVYRSWLCVRVGDCGHKVLQSAAGNRGRTGGSDVAEMP